MVELRCVCLRSAHICTLYDVFPNCFPSDLHTFIPPKVLHLEIRLFVNLAPVCNSRHIDLKFTKLSCAWATDMTRMFSFMRCFLISAKILSGNAGRTNRLARFLLGRSLQPDRKSVVEGKR